VTDKTDKAEPQAQSPKDAKASADKASADVQDKVDEDLAKGYRGTVPDPIPNEEYSLKTGPDSPALVPDNTTRVEMPQAPAPESKSK
jgi:hypothetical protein